MIICEKERIRVRSLDPSDVRLLVKWLSNPQVLEYYEGRDHSYNEQMVEDQFYAFHPNVTRCVIEYNKIPIGYLQFYPIEKEVLEEYGYHAPNHVVYGTDQFIGEIQFWNKGIGTDLMKVIIEYLVLKRGAQNILLDPQCRNSRAIACYEKSGLKKIKLLPQHEMHEGKMEDCWLMEYDAIYAKKC